LRCALEGLGMQDDVSEEYFAWHGSRVRRQALMEEYDRACELALGKGLDLKLIHADQEGVYQFLIDHGIMEGPARRVVRDVEIFLDQQR
jgi:predicted deacylase